MDEFPRYRKKSTKRPPKKSDHKHEYTYGVFHYHIKTPFGFNEEFKIGTFCPVCGKIGGRGDLEKDGWLENTAQSPWLCMEWSDQAKKEFVASTRTLPYFEISDFFTQKFVDVDGKEQ